MRSEQLREGFASLVTQAGRQMRRTVDARLRPYGLTEATWLPLLYLSRAPAPMRQKDLAAMLTLDSSSVVRILDALQTSGLVERREEAGDRRAKATSLTMFGRSMAEQIEEVTQQVRREIHAGLTDDELETATRVLQHICRSLAHATTEKSV